MLKIIAAPVTRFRSAQHLRLMFEFIRLVLEETVAKLGLESFFPGFQKAVADENVAVEAERGSAITETIDELIIRRESYYSAFIHLIENGLLHFDQAKVDAAKAVKRLIDKKYPHILDCTKEEKLVKFQELTEELQNPENAGPVSVLGGTEWVTKIQEVNNQCIAHNALRKKESKERPTLNAHDARQITDKIYQDMVIRINAQVVVNGETDYLSFINQLNAEIESLKNTMAIQEAARKKQADAEAPKVG